MRRWLRNFPDKSSNLETKQIETEIKEIKQIVSKPENVVPATMFETQEKQKTEFNGTKLLGELLGYLRVNKKMAALMVCRQISKLELDENCVVIYQNADDEISGNEQICLELKQFFDSKGLGFKVFKPKTERDPVQELNEMLGGRLEIV